jgi:hypothetical protein
MADEGRGMEGMDLRQQVCVDLAAGEGLEGYALFADTTAFAPCLLALLGGKARQEIIEVAVAAVVPLEVTVVAGQPTGIVRRRAQSIVDEQGMHR